MKEKKSTGIAAEGDKLPVAQRPPARKQSLPERAEEYLREGGNIEDLPDPEQGKAKQQIKHTRSKK